MKKHQHNTSGPDSPPETDDYDRAVEAIFENPDGSREW